jgi:hypothetical protein
MANQEPTPYSLPPTSDPCPRCGAGAADLRAAAEQAAALPIAPSLKAEDRVYEARLSRCSACESPREGVLCAHCGCLVRFRARPKETRCPHPQGDRWAGAG